MSHTEARKLLQRAVAEHGQAEAARVICYSPATVSQFLGDKYQGNNDAVAQRIVEAFGSEIVVCPVLGEISLKNCSEHRTRPFGATNPLRVRLFRACKVCGVRK